LKDTVNCPPEIKNELKTLIKTFKAYDHGEFEPHRLLDKIGLFATQKDCETLGIKRGTPLAKAPAKDLPSVMEDSIVPTISLRSNNVGMHILEVVNPATPIARLCHRE
jgi:hypothetical protein